eukprot:s475_g35.t1
MEGTSWCNMTKTRLALVQMGSTAGDSYGTSAMLLMVVPDTLRLVSFLEARSLQPAIAASRSSKGQLQDTLAALRKVEANPDPGALEVFELEQGLRDLETVLAEAQQATLGNAACEGWDAAWQELSSLETKLETAMRYVYGPDWEVKPGKLVSKKGTWLKSSARFSWELSEAKGEKMYLPAGVAMPILQIGRVVDQEELKLHDWVCQHLRVWMKPEIVRTMQARYGIWFVYWPHFEVEKLGLATRTSQGEVCEDTLPGMAISTEDTDVCPGAARSKAMLPLKTVNDIQSPGLSDFMDAQSPSSPSEGSRWRRMIRPLANCIACGDFESELSKLKLQKSSTAARLGDCIRKLQEQDSSMEVLEKKLQETLSDLDARTAELEAEKRRTSSLSTLLLNDSVKEQKLQEEAKDAEERLEKAQKEIQRLVSFLKRETSEKERVIQDLRTKDSEAAGLSKQVDACKEQAAKCSAESQVQISMLEEKTLENEELEHTLARTFAEAEDLRSNLATCEDSCERLQGSLEAQTMENEKVNIKLSERTQELTEARDEIRNISKKLSFSTEQLDQHEKKLHTLSSALRTAQEETRSKMQQVENVSMSAEDFLSRLSASKQHLQHLEEEKRTIAESLALTTAEKQNISSRFEKLTMSLEDEQSKNAALQNNVQEQCARIRELEEINRMSRLEVQSITEEKKQVEEELAARRKEHEALTAQVSSVTNDLAAKVEENETLAAELSAAKAPISSLEQKVRDLDAAAKAAKSENIVLGNELEEKALELKKLKQDLKMEKDQLQTFDRRLSVVTTSLEDAVSDKQSLALELEGLQMERADLEGRLSRANSKNMELERALDEMASQAAANKEARDAAVQEICTWQINAQLFQSFVEHMSHQRDACLSECRDYRRAAQEKQREIDVLNVKLRHAENQSNELANASLAELTDQLGQSDVRMQMLSASIELKDSEMQALSRELTRKGMETEDYLGQVRVIQERWGDSEKVIDQLRISLGICQSDKDSVEKELVMKGKLMEEMGIQMAQAKEQLSKSQQETNILDRCLEDKQLQHDLLTQEVGCKESFIQNLQCELTAIKVERSENARDHEESLHMLKSTLEEQLQQNDLLQLQLSRKRVECEEASIENRSLFTQLAERTLERDDLGSQIQGMRTLINKLKDELRSAQMNETELCDKHDGLMAERAELQQQNQRLSALSAQLRRETDKSLAELQRKVDLTEKQRMEIMRLQKELKDSKQEVKNLNRCVTLEVRRREEAATRCAELLCSHPSMNIEAWIGKVRASSTSAEWQLVAGSGRAERVVLGGGQSFQPGLTSYETPCIIINHREQRKGSKKKSDQDRVPVNIYEAKKPGAVEVRKANKALAASRPPSRLPIVYDKICKLFNQNAVVYDQHFGVVRPFPDEDGVFSPRSSRSSSSRASSRGF